MQTRRVVRSEQWWDHKVPVLIGVGAVAVGARPGPAPAGALRDLLLLTISAVGVAAFGHLVNDWCDLDADAAAGKPNRLAPLPAGRRAAIVALAAAVGGVPWAFLHAPRLAIGLLAVESLLLVAYSAPPVRLKARGVLGVLADAAYAYVVPLLLVCVTLGPRGLPRGGALVGVLAAWSAVHGLRGIAWHQIDDADADRVAGTRTLVGRMGTRRVEAILAWALLPVEVVLLAVEVVLVDRWWLVAVAGAFLFWRTFQLLFLWAEPLSPSALRDPRRRVEVVGFEYVNVFVEQWVPLTALVALAVASPWWWVAVAVLLVAFRNAARTFLAWDLWVLPDGLSRLAHARRASRNIVKVAKARTAECAAGPAPLADPAAQRFVFVVCGPLLHLDTLDTAVRHLRPLTDAEVWVLTDPARNARPIDRTGLDGVVEVATPPELDDHQASIWLKTSVHRHVPPGEWCYLDTDVIAVGPGVEEVFAHRTGPVAFASDLTIRENSVDRFSPWAMTCSCLGYDDEHSCGHLREQLQVRFRLEVPPTWLHWNGGVFAFGPDSAAFLDTWHERAVASFGWPEWKTRDQGALIATVWTFGLQDQDRLPPTFNFIADLGNHDLCLDPDRGWSHHPSGPWYRPRFLHLYTSALEDPRWDLGRDVEAVVLRRSGVRIFRYRRSAAYWAARGAMSDARSRMTDRRWAIQTRFEIWGYRLRRLPRRLAPARLRAAIGRRMARLTARDRRPLGQTEGHERS